MTETIEQTTRRYTFLCVVDNSDELSQALRYACRRAKSKNGRVALLYVMEPAEFQHWMSVGELMQAERREEAEEMLQVVAAVVKKRTGNMPVLYIREGKLEDELLNLLNEETDITNLVLGAATGSGGPGPLVVSLVEKKAGSLRVPVTIVPGNMTQDQIDGIA